jgi:site-specific DNA-methyltransferase (adenine-specific)
MDKPIDLKLLWKELKRVGTDNCAFIFFASGLFTHDLIESNRKDFKYTLVWDKIVKTGFLNSKKMPLRQHEDLVVFYSKQPTYNPQFTKGKPSHIRGLNANDTNNVYGKFKNPMDQSYTDDKYPTSIIRIPKNARIMNHPTEKPVPILEYLIKTYSNESDTVLDPTMGSGSCGEACLNINRKFIGIELDDNYFEMAKQRIENHVPQKSLF